jgi:hypothetical protein
VLSTSHPYREPQATVNRPAAALGEELILYVALCAVGAIPVVIALVRGGAFGVEPTLGLAMIAAGLLGLLAGLRAARVRCPRTSEP